MCAKKIASELLETIKGGGQYHLVACDHQLMKEIFRCLKDMT